MNYIVFDLEWNQSPYGKKKSNQRLPFEIIEIGAVMLNEQYEVMDTFHRLIKPQVYKWIHDSIHEVIHVNYKDLEHGVPFTRAAREFLEWCGPRWTFVTWGNQDVMELQRNMKYYGMLDRLPGPVTYYDAQKLFSLYYENSKSRRALEYAIDYLKIEKNGKFHRALSDAVYTAQVIQTMDMSRMLPYSSIDVYQNPKKKKEELHLSYPSYDKYISREFSSKEKLLRDREVCSTRCPICHLAAKRRLRWFVNHSKNYESISQCQEHGYIKGKIRIRKTEEEMYYAVKTLRFAQLEEAEALRNKRESLRQKRHTKKSSDKEI